MLDGTSTPRQTNAPIQASMQLVEQTHLLRHGQCRLKAEVLCICLLQALLGNLKLTSQPLVLLQKQNTDWHTSHNFDF